MATAPIGPLAWEPSYAAGLALKRQKKKICQAHSFGLVGWCPGRLLLQE